jgi:hypothetical protein
VIVLHDHGVTTDWTRGMAGLGYGGLGTSELTRLHAHGVTTDFVRSLQEAGHRNLSAEDLIRAATRGPEALGRPAERVGV